MAKGDHKRAQDMIYRQQRLGEGTQQRLDDTLYRDHNTFQNNYNRGSSTNFQNYDDIMRGFQGFFNDPYNPNAMSMGDPYGWNMQPYQPYQYPYQPAPTPQRPGLPDKPQLGQQQQSVLTPPSQNQFQPEQQYGPGMQNVYGSTMDPQQFAQQWFQNNPLTAESMNQMVGEMQKMGMNVVIPTHEGGTKASKDKIVLPNGQVVDIFSNEGSGNSQFTWQADPNDWYGSDNMVVDPSTGQITNYGDYAGRTGLQVRQGKAQHYPESIFGGGADALNQAMGGYSEFARTGGFSPEDIQDIRARAVSPIRSVYSSAKSNLERAKGLSGGYLPNYVAANAKMAREQANTIGDMNENVNASIAGMRQQGRLAGLGGLSQVGQFGSSQDLARSNALMQARLGALGGMTSLYGSAPGMGQTYGNQLLGAGDNLNRSQANRNNMANSLMGNMINSASIPGNFQSAMGNITSAFKPISQIASVFSPFGGGGGGGIGGNRYGWSA